MGTQRSVQMATYKNAKITELEAKLASAGLSRYLTITNDDFINLAEVAAFDASGNQLTPVHASMNNEYGHGHGANKCIDGIDGRVPWYFFGWGGMRSDNNMCHSQPSDASGLQWLPCARCFCAGDQPSRRVPRPDRRRSDSTFGR